MLNCVKFFHDSFKVLILAKYFNPKMSRPRYKITRTGDGMLLSLHGSAHRFILTDDAVKESFETGNLRVRYIVPGDIPMHGMCILTGLDVTRAADHWMNGEFDYAMMILMPMMVENVRVALCASEKFLTDWGKQHKDQEYKFNLN